MLSRKLLLPALAVGALIAVAPAPARAGEIQVAALAGGEGSSWRGDGTPNLGLKLGYRFKDVVAPYFLGRLGYGPVDERLLELIQIGVQAWARIGITRPYARFGFVHQHEEPWAAVKADVLGAIFGVGDGIRHRMGLEGALGVDIPWKQYKAFQFHATIEAFVTGFPDSKGPAVYPGGTAGIGFNYQL